MNDPHVESLRYRLELGPDVKFEAPPPLTHETPAFRIDLKDGTLTATMNEHHPDEKSARNVVEPFLRAWEIDVALRDGRSELHFAFESAETIDRVPTPSAASMTLHGVCTAGKMGFASRTKLTLKRARYPDPPIRLTVTPPLEAMWYRYERCQAGREQLLPMAYFCLSVFQHSAEGRGNAARRYCVHRDVLDRLGELTSECGDLATARKVNAASALRPLTTLEEAWIQDVLRILIRRMGEYAADSRATLKPITMRDLPRLEPGN